MSKQRPEEPSKWGPAALLARGLRALDGKSEAVANCALRIARDRLAPRPSAALRRAIVGDSQHWEEAASRAWLWGSHPRQARTTSHRESARCAGQQQVTGQGN